MSDEVLLYWSCICDIWLWQFVIVLGNDLLVGIILTVVVKVVSIGWYLEGLECICNLYCKMLFRQLDFGNGWDMMFNKVVFDYLIQDSGGWIECIRIGIEGVVLGFVVFDNEQMWIIGNFEYFVEYYILFSVDVEDQDKVKVQKLYCSQVIYLIDMFSLKEWMLGVGFCVVFRVMIMVCVLMDIMCYECEKLSDLLLVGLLMINNLKKLQWEDLMEEYDMWQ